MYILYLQIRPQPAKYNLAAVGCRPIRYKLWNFIVTSHIISVQWTLISVLTMTTKLSNF